MRLKLKYKCKMEKKRSTWKINNMLLDNQSVTENNQRGNLKIPRDK